MNASTSAPDPAAIADAYLAAWNEVDPSRRSALLRAGWTEDARYVDPLMRGEGLGAIGELIGAVFSNSLAQYAKIARSLPAAVTSVSGAVAEPSVGFSEAPNDPTGSAECARSLGSALAAAAYHGRKPTNTEP